MQDSTTTDRPDDMLEGAATMLPSEFCSAMGRPIPKWFNLDAIVTSEDIVKIETARLDLIRAMGDIIELARRVRWAADLGDRMDVIDNDLPEPCEIEASFAILNQILDLTEIREMALLASYLFNTDSTTGTEGIDDAVRACEPQVTGIEAAVAEARGGNRS